MSDFARRRMNSEQLRLLARSASNIVISRSNVAYEDDSEDWSELDDPDVEDEIPMDPVRANGKRAWYPDFTTIDWVHDGLKERARIRSLRANGTAFANAIDSAQGWVLLVATGVIVGITASAIDVSETALLRLRDGFCWNDIFRGRRDCASSGQQWVTWGDVLGREFEMPVYVASGILLALLGTLIVHLSAEERISDDGKVSVTYPAAGGAIAEVKTILGGFVIRGFLGFRTMVTKIVALVGNLNSGLNEGLYGALFIHVTQIWAQFKKSSHLVVHPIFEVILVAFVTSLLNYPTELTRQLGVNGIAGVLFSECKPDDDLYGLCSKDTTTVFLLLAALVCSKVLLTFVTYGIRVPGGFFASTMLIGACIGRIVGLAISTRIYALVGGAATMAGVTRSTVSLVVIMVELTGATKLVLPIMITVMVAKWTGDGIIRDSIYDSSIKRSNYPYLDHKREHHPSRGSDRGHASAGDVCEYNYDETFQVDVAYSWQEIDDKLKLLSSVDDGGYAVLDGNKLVGYIAFQDLKHASTIGKANATNYFHGQCMFVSHGVLNHNGSIVTTRRWTQTGRTDLSQWMDRAPLSVMSLASMDLVVEIFMKVGCKTVCVVDYGGEFVGTLRKKRVIAWLRE
ncbi:hypothetical protein HDU83_005188 [Entophlyctis luteolus]|nr:hypothetical protein HDU83_005188 [Entophlyctis luteolus]